MPSKISNCFSFCFSPDLILIMGGIVKKEGGAAMHTQN